jgi:hypothetical protein
VVSALKRKCGLQLGLRRQRPHLTLLDHSFVPLARQSQGIDPPRHYEGGAFQHREIIGEQSPSASELPDTQHVVRRFCRPNRHLPGLELRLAVKRPGVPRHRRRRQRSRDDFTRVIEHRF